jgi:hypothetical protein
VWCEDKDFLPCWFHRDCVMVARRSRIWPRTIDLRMIIPGKKISITMASLEAYESQSNSD